MKQENSGIEPNPAVIREHLTHITRRWPEISRAALLEVVHLTDADVAKVANVAHFPPTPQGIEDAVQHIAAMNRYRLNAYACVNPVDAANRPPANKRASKEHILCSFVHFADSDTAESAENIRQFVGPKCTFYVVTGTVPFARPHVYWDLENPIFDMDAWSATQADIAGTLGTDSVIDAPRIMRLAGTINWPKPSKQEKRGYVSEITTLHIHSPEDRPPVTSEQMSRAFAGGAGRKRTAPNEGEGFKFDSGIEDKGAKFAEYLRQCSEEGKKHVGIRGVSSMLGSRHVEPDLVEALVRHISPVWDENVENLIRTGYKFAPETDDAAIQPVDIWGSFSPPPLPLGLLPPVLEEFAVTHGRMMGADPSGLAAAALCIVCAAIPDSVKVRVKVHDEWSESARIWVALVGDPSTRKSPILNAAERPLRQIDTQMFRDYIAAKSAYDALSKDEKAEAPRPRQIRKRLEDTTIEAAQEVMSDSPDGLVIMQDELSGWFGGMDRYSNGKGGKDRGFWLQAFNGGQYGFNRVGRGAGLVENLSACVLGGIQPDPIRKVVGESSDDGLIQRLFPVILAPASLGTEDAPPTEALSRYNALIPKLARCEVARVGFSIDNGSPARLRFDAGAQMLRRKLEEKHLGLMAIECLNRKLAAHIGKYDGLFARLCVAFHCAENGGELVPQTITEDTARRVAAFLHRFFLPHAIAFYGGLLGMSDDHDRMASVAGYILAHRLETVSARDVARGDSTMRKLTRAETVRIFEQLEALGWVSTQATVARSNAAPTWVVNPAVHQLFTDRRDIEAARRKAAQAALKGGMEWKS